MPDLRGLSPTVNHTALLSRVISTLRFAVDVLKRRNLWTENIDPFMTAADKLNVEAALLALIASRIPNPTEDMHRDMNSLLSALHPLVRSERNKMLLLKLPQTAVPLGVAHTALARAGAPDEEFNEFVGRALASGHADATERIPYRAMELWWLRNLFYRDTAYQSHCEALLPNSILATSAHPVTMFADDAYAITHALMYLTDFGALLPPPRLDVPRAAEMVDACMAWHVLSENLDVLGELLMSSALLRMPWSPYAKLAWWLLDNAWNERGFLPGPQFDPATYERLDGHEAHDYVAVNAYHTTFVGGILCALMLCHPEEGGTPVIPPKNNNTNSEIIARCVAACAHAAKFCNARNPDSEAMGAGTEGPALEQTNGNAIDPSPAPWQSHRQADPGCPLNPLAGILVECERLCGRSRFGYRDFQPGQVMDCGALAVVLGDAVLIHAARNYDLALLGKTLTSLAQSELPVSHTMLEATTFLIQQQLPCGALGAYFATADNLRSPQAREVTLGLAYCLALVAARLARDTSSHSIRVRAENSL